MTGEPETVQADRRPRWGKNRWRAAAAVAVVITPPFACLGAIGPAAYCVERAWIPDELFAATCSPLLNALPNRFPGRSRYWGYIAWWLALAGKHDGHQEFYMFE